MLPRIALPSLSRKEAWYYFDSKVRTEQVMGCVSFKAALRIWWIGLSAGLVPLPDGWRVSTYGDLANRMYDAEVAGLA